MLLVSPAGCSSRTARAAPPALRSACPAGGGTLSGRIQSIRASFAALLLAPCCLLLGPLPRCARIVSTGYGHVQRLLLATCYLLARGRRYFSCLRRRRLREGKDQRNQRAEALQSPEWAARRAEVEEPRPISPRATCVPPPRVVVPRRTQRRSPVPPAVHRSGVTVWAVWAVSPAVN